MRLEHSHDYGVAPQLPMEPFPGGTNLLVTGESARGAREVALRLLTNDVAEDQEGLVLVSADVGAPALLDRCDDVTPGIDHSRVGIVDCAGTSPDDRERFTAAGGRIEDPGELEAIWFEYARLYEALVDGGAAGIRVGLVSVSSMLMHAAYRDVTRFVHMLTGRVIANGDLSVLLVDSSTQDERTVKTYAAFADATIEVRSGESSTYELRVEEGPFGPGEWTPLEFESGDGDGPRIGEAPD